MYSKILRYLLLSMTFTTSLLVANACSLTNVNGINQWRLIYSVGECVATSADILCSKIEMLTTTIDQLTLLDLLISEFELLISQLESCSICSGFDVLTTQIDTLTNNVSICCNMLSNQDLVIKSDVDSVSTKVDSVGSQVNIVNSALAQLATCEIGTLITQSQIPYTISVPGVYTLCGDVTNSSGFPAITINSGGVVLNLNQYSITSSTTQAISCTGVSGGVLDSIVIKNGLLQANGSVETVTITYCEQVEVSDLQVVRSPNGLGFNINNTFNAVFERCNFDFFGTNVSSSNSVFLIQGTSDAIIVRSCEILNAGFYGFTVSTTSANANGILFEDCLVGRPRISGGAGFFVTNSTAGLNSVYAFKNCTANVVSIGFLISSANNVVFEDCHTSDCTTAGFELTTAQQFSVEGCTVSSTGSGFILNSCQHGALTGNIAQEQSGGGGSGSGFLIVSSSDIIIDSCDAQNFNANGILISVSDTIVNFCTSSANTTNGILVPVGSTATIRNSNFIKNNIGINATATTTALDIIIKDCLVAHNITNGINDNGIPIYILDTRSFNPGPDNIAASTAGGTVITY